jgi:sensor histidine kinase regulating citrate/malate metabolism
MKSTERKNMSKLSTINGLIELAKAHAINSATQRTQPSNPKLKTAIESVLGMLLAKSGNDPKFLELASTVRSAIR